MTKFEGQYFPSFVLVVPRHSTFVIRISRRQGYLVAAWEFIPILPVQIALNLIRHNPRAR